MRTAIVLLTRDLRVHDNPALAAACASAAHVVPLFVVDPSLRAGANRRRFLAESLADLRECLRRRGGDLVLRTGDPATEAIRLADAAGASSVFVSADASGYAQRRERRLAEACRTERLALRVLPGVTVVPPGHLRPTSGGDHYRVFTPYWHAWCGHRRRPLRPPPQRVTLPPGIRGSDPAQVLGRPAPASPDVPPGGETEGRRRLASWSRTKTEYAHRRDDLPGDATSRLSAYLHFGCLSPREVAATLDGDEAFARQLCWRDFYHQVLAAFPELPATAYRAGAVEKWREDENALAAWQSGHTGVPIVDAGMRQLATQGWMHNRTRLITGAYLTKHLGLDWRAGLDWYGRLLVDADVANNAGNWQWVAGTGNDTRRRRGFNPIRQARRFDPDGDYVRRWVGELAHVEGGAVHEPWLLDRPPRGYPAQLDDGEGP
jgi:deoxyribodipyrimidine photo-lyase